MGFKKYRKRVLKFIVLTRWISGSDNEDYIQNRRGKCVYCMLLRNW
jgi:hypothetical protein